MVSNSKERLEILRDLFDVSLYRRLTEKLKADAADARREIEDGYRLNGQRLRAEGFASSDELSAGIAIALEGYEVSRLAASETAAALNAANSEFAAAEAQEKLFSELNAAEAALKELEGKALEFETMRARKSRADLARRMADLDSNLTDARERHAAAEIAQINAAEAAKRAQEAALAAKAELDILLSREHELDRLSRNVDELERHKQVLADSADRHAQHEVSLGALNDARQVQDQAAQEQLQWEQVFEERLAAHRDKQSGGMGAFYRSAHELIAVMCKGDKLRTNNIQLGKHGRDRSNVWCMPGANRPGSSANEMLGHHATPKPVEMCIDAILDVTNRGDAVLDPFLGSGTTLIAAEKSGRRCYGIELEPGFVDVTILRWQRLTGKQAFLAGTNQSFDAIAQGRQD